MNFSTYFPIIILLSCTLDMTNSFCDEFPFGHTCRNMDLTGFCLQVSHFLRIRDRDALAPPYPQFEKIFHKLRNEALADKPFVYFGGYKRSNVWGCPNEHYKKCTPPTPAPTGPPPPSTTTVAPCVPTPGQPPCPPLPPPICKPGYIKPACNAPNEKKGPPSGTDTTKPGYEGCAEECECCLVPPDHNEAKGTIWSLQDGCELKYLKAAISPATGGGGVLNPIGKETPAKENPYRLEITEIAIKGTRLHNWLHIKIYSNGTAGLNSEDLGSGKIKMAFIMAQDEEGLPVGEFVNNIPCGAHQPCKPPVCHQGTVDDTFPCMIDSAKVTSNTGMMMVYSSMDGKGEGLSEIHGTWRFSQAASPANFVTELHFTALLVDEFAHYKILANDSKNVRLTGMSQRRINKVGMVGWNPLHDILHPTIESVGAYDYFREDVFYEQDVNCHLPINPKFYVVEPYPDSGNLIRQVDEQNAKEHCYRLNNTYPEDPLPAADNIGFCYTSPTGNEKRYPVSCPGPRAKVAPWFHDAYGFIVDGKVDTNQTYPWTLFGARTEAYALRDGALKADDWTFYKLDDPSKEDDLDATLYFNLEQSTQNSMQYAECATGSSDDYFGMARRTEPLTKANGYDIQGRYGHFCGTDGYGRRVKNFPPPVESWPNTLADLWKFPPINADSYQEDRCFCPRIPPTPDPRYREPPEVQVQGRRQHAYQMIIAWNCIVPFGIFISRYFKETYSKVFFLQEYWWYTIHVLCMVSAAMFTFGGLYVMELKRKHPINWLDRNITIHVIIGYTIISLFFFQVVTGFFRLKDPKKRMFQILTHWLLGVIEYLLAIVCMITSAFILLSGMTCEGVVALGFLIVFQVMFYASMEVHLRNVDKKLKLAPKRTYLPPPIMRVFHKDAPDAKFRVKVLIAYFCLCCITSLVQFVAMESNTLGESCFIKSRKFIDPSELYEDY